MNKPTHECPLCKGTGKVTAKVAKAKITTRNREVFNAAMRKINGRVRAARNTKKAIATE